MKNIFAKILFFALVVCTISCKKTAAKEEKNKIFQNSKENFVFIDSLRVRDSVQINKNLRALYDEGLLVFPNLRDKRLLDSLYFFAGNKIKDYSYGGLKSYLEQDKKEYFEGIEKTEKEWRDDLTSGQEWFQNFRMKKKLLTRNFLHIEYYTYSYEGGAHGNYAFYDRVFDLKNKKRIGLDEITSLPKRDLQKLLKKNVIKASNGKGSEIRDALLVEEIPTTQNFFFDKENLYFHYSPYEIAAYAVGDVVIPISWDELGNSLDPDFAKKLKNF
ncbi:MAG: DUF3298 and DUF4163 domain-containing protein [Bergeyella sp.]|nr:DUF3298 and DUF4163 domain-containing protein [Bergeyella sp.]